MSNAVRWAYERGDVGFGDVIVICRAGPTWPAVRRRGSRCGAALVIVTGTVPMRLALRSRVDLAPTSPSSSMTTIPSRECANSPEVAGPTSCSTSGGSVEPIVQAVDMVRPGGTIVLAGLKNQKKVGDLVTDKIVIKEISLVGALSSSWSSVEHSVVPAARYRTELPKLCTHAMRSTGGNCGAALWARNRRRSGRCACSLDCTRITPVEPSPQLS